MSYDDKRVGKVFSAITLSEEEEERVQEIRRAGFELATTILRHAPASPEQTLAINKVRDGVMYAYQAVGLHKRLS